MRQTIYPASECSYHFEDCTISHLTIKRRTLILSFLAGFYKGEELVGGALQMTNLHKDSFLYYKKRKHSLSSLHHLDLHIDGFTVGTGYVIILGTSIYGETCLCVHHLGEIIIESVS